MQLFLGVDYLRFASASMEGKHTEMGVRVPTRSEDYILGTSVLYTSFGYDQI